MRKPFSAYLIGLMTLVAASWPTTMVEAQTAQQIAAELFDYPIHEIGDPSVLGAKFGCDVSLIDTWDELQMVLLLAAFDPNQLQAALHGLAGPARVEDSPLAMRRNSASADLQPQRD
jgi:hypothetical protein